MKGFMNKIKLSFAVLLPFIMLTGCIQEENTTPLITSFVFDGHSNTGIISSDISGVIDQNTKHITVYLPETLYNSSTNRAALKSTIEVSNGTSLLTSRANQDYSTNPVMLRIANGNNSAAYTVEIKEENGFVKKGSLLFTEYYSGAGYKYKNSSSDKTGNNQYIEITNMSTSSVDLGNVYLTRTYWSNGIRFTDKDQTESLSGTLASGECIVIYSQRMGSSFVSKIKSNISSNGGIALSDAELNSIISLQCYDGLILSSEDGILDVIGPDSGNGSSDRYYGKAKLMCRKGNITYYDSKFGWNEDEWIEYSATNTTSDLGNAGIKTVYTDSNKTDCAVTYFGTEDSSTPTVAAYNSSTNCYTYKTFLKENALQNVVWYPVASTNGQYVRAVVNGNEEILCGVNKISLKDYMGSTNKLSLKVYDYNNKSYEDYGFYVDLQESREYTEDNYDFNGELSYIIKSANDSTTYPLGTGYTVSGILTCYGVYGYKSATDCFFLQDQNAGLYFYLFDSGSDSTKNLLIDSGAKIGNKIQLTVKEVKIYKNMIEVTQVSDFSILDDGEVYPIYYKTGDYNSSDCVGKVFMYNGSIESGLSSYVGTFSGSNKFFYEKTDYTWVTQDLSAGVTGKFYGPVLIYNSSNYCMALTRDDQIVLQD